MTKKQRSTWGAWVDRKAGETWQPPISRAGRLFDIEEGAHVFGLFGRGPIRSVHYAKAEEWQPVYGRRPRGGSAKGRPRVGWRVRAGREFKTRDGALAFIEAQL